MPGDEEALIDVEKLLLVFTIQAKRNGREWLALCPYHQDRKPSWSIRDQPGHDRHGAFHCFSCGAGGDAVQLTADLLDVDRKEAKEWLVATGISAAPDVPFEVELESRMPAQVIVGQSIAVPAGVVIARLEHWVTSARDYATSRGITADQVMRWGLGFAVTGRCRGRIWIPVRDGSNKLMSWMARSYTGSPLRYLTPSREEAPVRDGVFGACLWQDSEQVVVCEGALNALACERAGARNVAALGGSNVTPLQMAVLGTFNQILVLTDPDAAGDKAASAIQALGRWRYVIRVELPPGKDPSDLTQAELQKILTDPWPSADDASAQAE